MKCPKCGAENIEGSTFCVKCGVNIKEFEPVEEEVKEEKVEEVKETVEEKKEPVSAAPVAAGAAATPIAGFFTYLLAALMKPKTAFKEEEEKLGDTKFGIILSLIVAGVMTVLTILNTIYTTVRVTSFFSGETKWVWENLKNVKWIEVIGKNFLIYLGVMFAIAGVFYLGCLLVKKDCSFIKNLSIAATSMVPIAVCSMLLAPIGGMIWVQLSFIFIIVGMVYSCAILFELLNTNIKLDGDIKIYFNAACTSVLLIAAYFIASRLLVSTLTKGLF